MTHEIVALHTVSEFLKRGISPSYSEDGVLVINQRCIRDGRISLAAARRNDVERRGVPDDRWLRRWDVVVNSTGVGTLGRVAQLTEIPSEPMTVDSHVTIVRPDLDQVDGRYFGYALRKCQQQIEAMGEGATGQTELSRRRLGDEVMIGLPPRSVQRKIAAVLAAYDELIENNLRRIEILEEMAQAVYREWFVNFRFPGHEDVALVESPIGPIPEGWEVVTMSDFTTTQYGYTASTEDQPIGPKFLRGMDFNKRPWIDWSEVPYCRIPGNEFKKYKVKTGDVLVIRMADPGKVGIVEKDVEAVFASYVVRVTPDLRQALPYWLFYFMSSPAYQRYISGAGTGTTRKSASAGVLTGAKMVLPPVKIQAEFVDAITPLRRLLNNLIDQNANLRATRDLLLPKLVSGEIDVSDLDIDTEWMAS